MATFKTYDSVGIKEDISDFIDTLPDTDTEFSDDLGSRTVTQPIYKWQENALLKGGDNAKVEGADAVDDKLETTRMLMNGTQIMSRTVNMSGTLEATDHYGRKDEYARQIVEKGKQLRQDYEFACIGRDGEMELGSDTVPRRFASAFGLVDDGNRIVNSAAAGGAALSEDTVKKVLRKSFTVGANISTLLMAPTVGEQTESFKGNASNTRDVNGSATTINNVVRVYITTLGTVAFKIARNMKEDYALAYRKGTYKRAVLKGRSWSREVLGKTGDSKRTQLLGEYGLQIDNSKGAIVVTGIKADA